MKECLGCGTQLDDEDNPVCDECARSSLEEESGWFPGAIY